MVLFGLEFSIFLFQKHSIFYSGKMVFLENSCSWIFYFSQVKVFLACHISKIFLQSERKAWFYLAQNFRVFISKTFKFLFRKKICSLKVAVPEFQKYKKKLLWILPKSLKNKHEHEIFTSIFQGFCLLLRNTH